MANSTDMKTILSYLTKVIISCLILIFLSIMLVILPHHLKLLESKEAVEEIIVAAHGTVAEELRSRTEVPHFIEILEKEEFEIDFGKLNSTLERG